MLIKFAEMKILLFVLIVVTNSNSCDQSLTLPVIKATSQQWSGGAAGSGRGVYYTIYLGKISQADFVFDSLWVDGKRLPVAIKPNLSGSDTLVLSSTDFSGVVRKPIDVNGNPQTEEIKPVPFPISTTSEGVLGYLYKGERKYLTIDSWTRLKALFYP
jgi:hypothetical protein